MKNILKLSLLSLCACGAVISTTQLARANDAESASNAESDKQLVITEPAGASTSVSQQTSTTYQTGGATYQSGSTMQGSTYPSGGYSQVSGAAGAAPGLVTGREQDAYANCILHQYQLGKGEARVTDEHYWDNVPSDRLYAQYPGAGGTYQNFAYTGYSSPSSSATWSSSSTSWSGQQGQQSGLWYGPDGKVYNSATSMTPMSQSSSGSVSEPAGGQSSATQSSGAQSSATQYGTSGAQSSTESKSSQSQPGSATQEAAGAGTSTTGSSTDTSPSSTSTSPDQSSTSTQSSSAAGEGMSEKVRSSLKSDTTLSPISSNVTVQDQNGKVALNGTVKSEAEKQQIVSKAEEMAGSGNVIDNLQIKSDSGNGSSSPDKSN